MTEQTAEQSSEPFVTAYNTTPGPLVIDQAGRTLGGYEWGTVRADRAPARALLESGQLVKVEPRNDPGVNPDAALAFTETAQAHRDPREDGKPSPAAKTSRRRSSGQTEEA